MILGTVDAVDGIARNRNAFATTLLSESDIAREYTAENVTVMLISTTPCEFGANCTEGTESPGVSKLTVTASSIVNCSLPKLSRSCSDNDTWFPTVIIVVIAERNELTTALAFEGNVVTR